MNAAARIGGGISWSVKFNKLPAYAEGLGRRARKATFTFANEVIEGLKMKMREPKSGRIYIIGRRFHRASAPGEAPAILTGETYRSLQARNTGRGGTVQITAGGASRWLQRGTSRMAPRYFIEQEIMKRKKEFFDAIAASARFQED